MFFNFVPNGTNQYNRSEPTVHCTHATFEPPIEVEFVEHEADVVSVEHDEENDRIYLVLQVDGNECEFTIDEPHMNDWDIEEGDTLTVEFDELNCEVVSIF